MSATPEMLEITKGKQQPNEGRLKEIMQSMGEEFALFLAIHDPYAGKTAKEIRKLDIAIRKLRKKELELFATGDEIVGGEHLDSNGIFSQRAQREINNEGQQEAQKALLQLIEKRQGLIDDLRTKLPPWLSSLLRTSHSAQEKIEA